MSPGNDETRTTARRVVALETDLETTRATIKKLRKAASQAATGEADAARLTQAVARATDLQAEISRLSQDVSEVALGQARRRRQARQQRREKARKSGGGSAAGGRKPASSAALPTQRRSNPIQKCERCRSRGAQETRRAWLCSACVKDGWGRCARCDLVVRWLERGRCRDCAQLLGRSVRTVAGGLFEGNRRRH